MVNSIPGHQNVADAVCIDGVQGVIYVDDTPVPARVGAENANRKLLTVYNNSDTTIYWGWNEDVDASTGTPIFGYTLLTFAVSSDANVWLVSDDPAKLPGFPAFGVNTRITEAR